MKKRILYRYVNSMLVSKESFLCKDKYLHIEIRKAITKYVYSINDSDYKEIASGSSNSIAGAKSKAKKLLIEHGAIFGDEVRGKVII